MADIVRGTVIAGRYVVSEREHPWIHERPELGTVCSAIDAILDEQVTLYIAPTETAGDMLDAARRAALVDDPRLPGILDVGRDEAGFDYCVQEYSGESWLREVLAHGPLEPAQARALIGEVADVLTAASRRGLHHLRLGPDSVSLSDDGTVHVHGLAIDAAVADHIATVHLDQISIPQAKREDALSLLDLLYLAQTAHWPGENTRDGFPAAPRDEGRPVASRTLNADVDEELDRLLDVVMAGKERGPQSASELAAFLKPWSTETLAGLASRPAPEHPVNPAPVAPDVAPAPLPPASEAGPGTSDQATPATASPASPVPYAPGRPAPGPHGTDPGTPATPAAAEEQRASPAQLQAARRRIARAERPGTKGLAAGVVGEQSHDPFHDELSMRAASTFPVAAEDLFAAERDTPAWEPAQRGDTGPIRRYSPETGAIPIVHTVDGAEDDDDAWFLGGMFTTDEEELQRNLRREREETAEMERLRHRLANPAADRRPGAVSPADDPDPSTQQLSIVFEDEPMPPKRLPWAEEVEESSTEDQPTIAMTAGARGAVEADEPTIAISPVDQPTVAVSTAAGGRASDASRASAESGDANSADTGEPGTTDSKNSGGRASDAEGSGADESPSDTAVTAEAAEGAAAEGAAADPSAAKTADSDAEKAPNSSAGAAKASRGPQTSGAKKATAAKAGAAAATSGSGSKQSAGSSPAGSTSNSSGSADSTSADSKAVDSKAAAKSSPERKKTGSATPQKPTHRPSSPAESEGPDAGSSSGAAASSGAKPTGPRPAAKRPGQPSTPPRPSGAPARSPHADESEDIGLTASGTSHTSLSLKGTSGQRATPTDRRRAPALRADQGPSAKISTATLPGPRGSSSRIGPSPSTTSRPVQTATAALDGSRHGSSGGTGSGSSRPPGPPPGFGPSASPGRADDDRGMSRRRRLAITLTVLAGIILVSLIVFLVVALPGGEDEATTASPADTTSEEQPPAEEEAPALVAPEIASVQDVDPLGDGDENPDLVDNLLSDSGDAWKTSTYTTAAFGGLKTGLGVVVTLSGEADLGVVEVSSLLAGGSFEIRNGDDPENGDVLGTGTFEDGTTQVELAEPVSTDAFTLWITELPSASDGYRAEITNISVASE